MKSFSETLTRLMKERRLTAREVAESTGIARTTLAEWTNGRMPQISQDLIKLAQSLGVSLEYLLTGKSEDANIGDELIQKALNEFTQLHQGVYRITIERQTEKPREGTYAKGKNGG